MYVEWGDSFFTFINSSFHSSGVILAHQLYATLSSDEFNFAHKKSRDSLESLLLKYSKNN